MADLLRLAESVGARLNDTAVRGKGIKFTIRPTGEKYRKANPVSGRRVNAVCWHGHYEFFRELFRAYPTAKVRADIVTYDGAQDFNAKAWDTGEARLCEYPESPWYAYTVKDCCHCEQ